MSERQLRGILNARPPKRYLQVSIPQGYRGVELLAALADQGRWADGDWDCDIRGQDAEWQQEVNALLAEVGYVPESE